MTSDKLVLVFAGNAMEAGWMQSALEEFKPQKAEAD